VAPDRERPESLRGLPLLVDLPDISGLSALVRTDFNVPLEEAEDGSTVVVDDFRIRMAVPTLKWLLDRGASVTCCSHLGRPNGKPDPAYSMAPVRERLALLCPGVTLMENLRFYPGEKSGDPRFIAQLVADHDVYVNEAFGVAHRSHASVVGPPMTLMSAAGERLALEVETIGGLRDAVERPFVAIVGGAKVADKLGVLEELAERVDVLAIGGGMAFTFLAAIGHDVGSSLVDTDHIEECRRLLKSHPEILLPSDVVALEPGGSFGHACVNHGPRGDAKVIGRDIPHGWTGLDIGPDSIDAFTEAICGAKTVFWNGPVGAFEDDRFEEGTRRVAEAVAASPGFTVVGGGDSASALDGLGLAGEVSFVSTGGGASLELLETGDLAALRALRSAPNAPNAPNAPRG
jgi:phosphoglycerate kinase